MTEHADKYGPPWRNQVKEWCMGCVALDNCDGPPGGCFVVPDLNMPDYCNQHPEECEGTGPTDD